MNERNFAATLIELCRNAMSRPERECLFGFLKFFALIAVGAALPLALAIAVNHQVISGLVDVCWTDRDAEGCKFETVTAREYQVLEGKIGGVDVNLRWQTRKAILGKDGEIPSAPVPLAETTEPATGDANLPLDPVAEHALYRTQVVFASALIFFWLLAAGVAGVQSYTGYRHWRTASYFRCSGGAYELVPWRKDIFVWFFLLTIALAGAVLTASRDVAVCLTGLAIFLLIPFGTSLLTAWRDAKQFDNRRHDLRQVPLFILPCSFSLGFMLGALAYHPFSNWIVPLVGPDGLGALSRIIFATSIALLYTAIVMSGLLIRSLARELPEPRRARHIARQVLDDPFAADDFADDLWDQMTAHVRSVIGDASVADPENRKKEVEAGTLPARNLNRAEAHFKFQPNPTFSGSRAGVFEKLVRMVSLPLALVMVTSLVVLGLGIDLLQLDPGAGDALIKARDKSEAALILMLGLGLSATFAILVYPALVRLDGFTPAGAAPSPAPKGDTHASVDLHNLFKIVTGRKTGGNVDLLRLSSKSRSDVQDARDKARERAAFDWSFPPDDAPIPLFTHAASDPLADTVLRRHIGAGKSKFRDILGANNYYGSFQDVLGNDLKGKILAVLTALAPIALPAIVEFVK